MRKAAGLILTLILSGAAPAERVPKRYERVLERIAATIAPGRAVRGDTIVLRVHLDLKERARTYPEQDPASELGQALETFRLDVPSTVDVIPVGVLREPLARTLDPGLDLGTVRVVEGHATWERPLVVAPDAKPGEHKIAVVVRCRIQTDVM